MYAGIAFAATAGLLAALASVAGKIATDSRVVPTIAAHIEPLVALISTSPTIVGYSIVDVTQTAIRAISFALIFAFNAVMMNVFVKAMNFSSSVTAVVINTASNFCFTALFGLAAFGEPLPPLWWCGAALILTGVSVIAVADQKHSEMPVEKQPAQKRKED